MTSLYVEDIALYALIVWVLLISFGAIISTVGWMIAQDKLEDAHKENRELVERKNRLYRENFRLGLKTDHQYDFPIIEKEGSRNERV